MSRKVTVGPSAQADLRSHARWLSQPGAGMAARRQLRAIRVAINDLADEPFIWPLSAQHPSFRERVVGRYVVLYRLDATIRRRAPVEDVYVIRVFGPGQDRTVLPTR